MAAFTTAIGMAVLGATASTAAATAVGVGLTGLAAYGATKMIGGMMNKPKTPSLPAAQQAQEPSVDRAAELAKVDLDKKKRAMSRNQTIFTSPLGLSDEDKSNTTLKTLTGV